MLNGPYPVIVFYTLDKDSKLPTSIVPIYLDEDVTGLYTASQNKEMSSNNDTIVDRNENGTMSVKQRPLSNSVEVSLVGNRQSIGLNIFLPIMDVIFTLLNEGNYYIAYFNENVLIFNAKLSNFRTAESRDNTKTEINFTLLKEDKPKKKGAIKAKNDGTITIPSGAK